MKNLDVLLVRKMLLDIYDWKQEGNAYEKNKDTRFPDFNDPDVVEEALNIIRVKLKAIDIIKKSYVGNDASFCKHDRKVLAELGIEIL